VDRMQGRTSRGECRIRSCTDDRHRAVAASVDQAAFNSARDIKSPPFVVCALDPRPFMSDNITTRALTLAARNRYQAALTSLLVLWLRSARPRANALSARLRHPTDYLICCAVFCGGVLDS